MNHDFLWKVLQKFNFPETFINCIKSVYANASSRILINGFLSREININCSVRQGCPMSMVLFVLYIEPLIRQISNSIPAVLVYDKFINVFAYADDLVVFIKTDLEFDKLFSILDSYGLVAQIRLNYHKSSFLRLNNVHVGPQRIHEVDSMKILGVIFQKTWSSMVNANYGRLITNLKAVLKMHNVRQLNILERCIVLNVYILSKLWYVAQIIPPSNQHLAQIKSACGKFIWTSFIFKLNRNQLYMDYRKGGLRLVDPEAKTKALFLKNVFHNYDKNGRNMEECYLLKDSINGKLSRNAREWLREGMLLNENLNLQTTHLLYEYLIDRNRQLPAIETKMQLDWENVWENVSSNFLPLNERAYLYIFINDLVPNKEKLKAYNIGHINATVCEKCSLSDTNEHRIKQCPKAKMIWDWCTNIIRQKMKINVNDIEDILQLRIHPTSKQLKAALWLTAKAISFNLRAREPSLFIFKKEIREIRWNNRNGFETEFGNYLNIC